MPVHDNTASADAAHDEAATAEQLARLEAALLTLPRFRREVFLAHSNRRSQLYRYCRSNRRQRAPDRARNGPCDLRDSLCNGGPTVTPQLVAIVRLP